MKITSFERNVAIENKYRAFTEEVIEQQLEKRGYEPAVIQRETDEKKQKQGIDYTILLEHKSHETKRRLYVDVKVRAASTVERFWNPADPFSQDIMVEYDQSGTGIGWANNPDYKTDYVLFVYPGLKNKGSFDDGILLPHDFLRYITTGEVKERLLDDQRIGKRKGYNGHQYSYCFILNVYQILDLYKEYKKNIPQA